MPRQIPHGVDSAHHLDVIVNRLLEGKSALVLEIEPAVGRLGMPVGDRPPRRLLAVRHFIGTIETLLTPCRHPAALRFLRLAVPRSHSLVRSLAAECAAKAWSW